MKKSRIFQFYSLIIFRKSTSVKICIPKSIALDNLLPDASPAIKISVFFETEEVTVPPRDSIPVFRI